MFLLLTSVFLTSDTRWLPLGWLKFAFWLSAVSQKQNKTKQKDNKISCPPVFSEKKKKKKKSPREVQAWKHLRTFGTTGNIQRKMLPLFLRPLPASPVPPQLLTDIEFGSRELEKGQR